MTVQTDALFARTPLAGPMSDPRVTEIMVNGPRTVFVEIAGIKRPVNLHFESAEQLAWLVERLMEQAPHRRLDASTPFADISLPDGSRVNIAIPPVVDTGPHLTIRKFSRAIRDMDGFVQVGTMDLRIAAFLKAAARARLNVLFSGAAGTGKTTMLELLAQEFDPRDRVVVIEDTRELLMPQPNVVRMVTRPANLEGRGAIGFDDLFRNSLRMRPDRILLGELRGPEAVSYLQAINSGHQGAMAIIHASTPHEAVLRIENLVASSGVPIPRSVVREQIAQGIDLIVQLVQYPDGVRRVTRVTEVANVEGASEPVLRHLFGFHAIGRDAHGHIRGQFVATGNRPTYMQRFALAGIELPDSLFTADEAARLEGPDQEGLPHV